MIEFLRKRGYTVLNLIEIRKPYQNENWTQTITVGEHEFDYCGSHFSSHNSRKARSSDGRRSSLRQAKRDFRL